MPFIYCLDKTLKNELITKGYKLLKQELMQNQTAWVFEFKPEITFDANNKDKYFISKTMRF